MSNNFPDDSLYARPDLKKELEEQRVQCKCSGGRGRKCVQRKAAEAWASDGRSRMEIRDRLAAENPEMSSSKRKRLLGYLPGEQIPPGPRKCLERTATETWIAEGRSRMEIRNRLVAEHPEMSSRKRKRLLGYLPGEKIPPGPRKCLERTDTETWIPEVRSHKQIQHLSAVDHFQMLGKKTSFLHSLVPTPTLTGRGFKSVGPTDDEVSVLEGCTCEVCLRDSQRRSFISPKVTLTTCGNMFRPHHCTDSRTRRLPKVQ